jgi:hypothetical protein
MSYDLYFYKKKGSSTTEQTIRDYLSENLTKPNEENNQWWFHNEDTGVYYCFETTEESEYENYSELFENFENFENLRFLFNLNFVRPDFFGQEAFLFVAKFMKDLDLYVLNPQSTDNSDIPYKPEENELYQNWAETNTQSVIDNFAANDYYYPLKETNEIWRHNYNKWNLQAEYDEVYYVPKIALFEDFNTKKIVTHTHWYNHFPYLIPKTDYIEIVKEKKGLLKTTQERGYISYKTFVDTFDKFFEDTDLPGYKLITPENAERVKKLFNSIQFEIKYDKLGLCLKWDKIFNAKP